MTGMMEVFITVVLGALQWLYITPQTMRARVAWLCLMSASVTALLAVAYQWWPTLRPLLFLEYVFEPITRWLLYGEK
ncbi:MAG: hypothetical protein K6T83_20670 [Alicyclobacillus sp.]|nr:hypothetical protein [Alicyclobacillus sp.]